MADGSIGQPIRRREDYRFLTGQGTYTDDINRPGQLHAFIKRSQDAAVAQALASIIAFIDERAGIVISR